MIERPAAGFWVRHVLRDDVIRALPIWIVVTALNTSAMTGALVFGMASRRTAPSPVALLVVLWLALTVFLAAGRGRSRGSRLDVTLPLAARWLWLSHQVATFVAGLVVLGASFGVMAAHEQLLGVETGWRGLAGLLVSGLLLVGSLLNALDASSRRPTRRRYYVALLLSSSASLALLAVLLPWPVLGVGVPAAAAVAVTLVVWRRMPPSFLTAAALPTRSGRRDSLRSERTLEGRSSVWRTVFRIVHDAPPWGAATGWALYGFVLLFGFLMGGGMRLAFDDQVLRVMYLPLASYALFTGVGVLIYQSFRIEPLPIDRHRLFALLMLPTLVVFLVGFAGARAALELAPDRQLVEYRLRGSSQWVDVPLRYLTPAPEGEVPILEAPWGESHPAWSTALFVDSGPVLYSEFNTAEPTSARFEAWLTSRAVETIYGVEIPWEEIRERYFVVEDERLVALAAGGLRLLEDYPQLGAPPGGPETPVFIGMVVVPWWLCVALFFRAFRAPASERRVKRAYWTLMLLLLAAMLGQAAGMMMRTWDVEAASALVGAGIRALGTGPWVATLAWVVAGVLGLAAYRLAAVQYRRAELPARPIRLALIDFAPSDS